MSSSRWEAAPAEARDPSLPNVIHWAADPSGGDAFLDGAYWALSWSLSTIFGDVLGALLEESTLSNVERWNGGQWVPVA